MLFVVEGLHRATGVFFLGPLLSQQPLYAAFADAVSSREHVLGRASLERLNDLLYLIVVSMSAKR